MKLTCAMCGATQASDQPGCSGWALMELGGRDFHFCPKEFPEPGAPASLYAAAKKRAQDKVLEILAAVPEWTCKVCGCTETSPCLGPEGACSWIVEDVLCSACLAKVPLPATEAELTAAMAPLFTGEDLVFRLPRIRAFQLMALLQLVLKHPDIGEHLIETGETLARHLQSAVCMTPVLAAMGEAGMGSRQDAGAPGSGLILPGDPEWTDRHVIE